MLLGAGYNTISNTCAAWTCNLYLYIIDNAGSWHYDIFSGTYYAVCDAYVRRSDGMYYGDVWGYYNAGSDISTYDEYRRRNLQSCCNYWINKFWQECNAGKTGTYYRYCS